MLDDGTHVAVHGGPVEPGLGAAGEEDAGAFTGKSAGRSAANGAASAVEDGAFVMGPGRAISRLRSWRRLRG